MEFALNVQEHGECSGEVDYIETRQFDCPGYDGEDCEDKFSLDVYGCSSCGWEYAAAENMCSTCYYYQDTDLYFDGEHICSNCQGEYTCPTHNIKGIHYICEEQNYVGTNRICTH